MGDDDGALAAYARAAEADPALLDARTNAAALHLLRGDPAAAAALCEGALAADPGHRVAWWNLNTSLRQLGRTEAAVDRSWARLEAATGEALTRPNAGGAVDQVSSSGGGSLEAAAAAAAGGAVVPVFCCVKWGKKYDAE